MKKTKINSGNLESPNKTMLPCDEKVEQNTINNNLNSNLKSQPTEITGTNNMQKEKINSGNLESPNKTMLPFNEKVEQNIINQQNKVNNEKILLTDKKGTKKMEERYFKYFLEYMPHLKFFDKNNNLIINGLNGKDLLPIINEEKGVEYVLEIDPDYFNYDYIGKCFREPINIFHIANLIRKLFGYPIVPIYGDNTELKAFYEEHNISFEDDLECGLNDYCHKKAYDSYFQLSNAKLIPKKLKTPNGYATLTLLNYDVYIPLTKKELKIINNNLAKNGSFTLINGCFS